jgi:hypothetical protein
MENAPQATKLLLVRMIRERGDQLKSGIPPWVISLIEVRKQIEAPVDSTPPPTQRLHLAAVPDERLPTPEDDAIWVDGVIRDLEAIPTKEQFDQFAKLPMVQINMKRLSTTNRAQFERADQAFSAKIAELADQETDQDDDTDPPEAA